MNFKAVFQSIISLYQEEFPFNLMDRDIKLPIDIERIITVTGIRRCGKSSLLALVINRLLQIGIPRKRILYIGFDDELKVREFRWVTSILLYTTQSL